MRAPPSTSPVKTKMAMLLFMFSLLSFASVLWVKDKNKHEGGRKNEVGLDPPVITIIDYTSVAHRLTTFTFH